MKRVIAGSGLLGIILLIIVSCNTGYRADIQSMLSPSALPYLKQSKLMLVSSMDSSGGNNDHIVIGPGKRSRSSMWKGPA